MGKSEYALSDNDRELYRPFSVVRQLSPASATALEFFSPLAVSAGIRGTVGAGIRGAVGAGIRGALSGVDAGVGGPTGASVCGGVRS